VRSQRGAAVDGLCGSCPGVVARGCAEHGGLNPWRRRPCAAVEEGVPSARGHNSRQRRCGGGAAERVVEEGAPSACRGGREVAAGSLGGDGRWEREGGRWRRGGEWSRGEEGLGFPVAGGAE